MDVPAEYAGREQTYLKHRVLAEYLVAWGIKLGSLARRRPETRLWFVDCMGARSARAKDRPGVGG